MKIECVKEKVRDVVSKAEKVSGKNPTLPVLSCLLIQAKKGNLVIKATNLDLGIEITTPAKVEKEGEVAVPGHILSGYLSNTNNEKNILIELVEKNLVVSTKNSKATIKAQPHEDFPMIPAVSDGKGFKIGAKDLVNGLKSVWYSSSTSTMKPELSSVYIHSEGPSLFFAATDSFRLAEKKINLKKDIDVSDILIPFKNVSEIVRIFDNINDELDVQVSKNQISFSGGGIYLTSRLVEGNFPDYKQIIPKEKKTEVVVLKEDFINSLKTANIFSDSFNHVNFKIKPAVKTFEIGSKNSNIGESRNTVQAVLEGEELDINFNYKYVADCLQSINSDSLALSFNGLSKPVIIKGVGDASFLYLVMPMNR